MDKGRGDTVDAQTPLRSVTMEEIRANYETGYFKPDETGENPETVIRDANCDVAQAATAQPALTRRERIAAEKKKAKMEKMEAKQRQKQKQEEALRSLAEKEKAEAEARLARREASLQARELALGDSGKHEPLDMLREWAARHNRRLQFARLPVLKTDAADLWAFRLTITKNRPGQSHSQRVFTGKGLFQTHTGAQNAVSAYALFCTKGWHLKDRLKEPYRSNIREWEECGQRRKEAQRRSQKNGGVLEVEFDDTCSLGSFNTGFSNETSAVVVAPSLHFAQRAAERGIPLSAQQTTLKYGTKTTQLGGATVFAKGTVRVIQSSPRQGAQGITTYLTPNSIGERGTGSVARVGVTGDYGVIECHGGPHFFNASCTNTGRVPPIGTRVSFVKPGNVHGGIDCSMVSNVDELAADTVSKVEMWLEEPEGRPETTSPIDEAPNIQAEGSASGSIVGCDSGADELTPARPACLVGQVVKCFPDRSFGFLCTGCHRSLLFFGVSATAALKLPDVGTIVTFQLETGPDERPRAQRVVREGEDFDVVRELAQKERLAAAAPNSIGERGTGRVARVGVTGDYGVIECHGGPHFFNASCTNTGRVPPIGARVSFVKPGSVHGGIDCAMVSNVELAADTVNIDGADELTFARPACLVGQVVKCFPDRTPPFGFLCTGCHRSLLFFGVSATAALKLPDVGTIVTFQLETGQDDRPRAQRVVREGEDFDVVRELAQKERLETRVERGEARARAKVEAKAAAAETGTCMAKSKST